MDWTWTTCFVGRPLTSNRLRKNRFVATLVEGEMSLRSMMETSDLFCPIFIFIQRRLAQKANLICSFFFSSSSSSFPFVRSFVRSCRRERDVWSDDDDDDDNDGISSLPSFLCCCTRDAFSSSFSLFSFLFSLARVRIDALCAAVRSLHFFFFFSSFSFSFSRLVST